MKKQVGQDGQLIEDEFFECHEAGCIEVMGVAHAEDDCAEVRLSSNSAQFLSEKIRSPKEKFPFNVDDSNVGVVPLLQTLGKVAFLIEDESHS